MKELHFRVNYHGNDIDVLEDTKYYFTNIKAESILIIDEELDMSELSDDLREELKEGLKHKINVFVLV